MTALSDIRDLLEPGLKGFTGKYEEIKPVWKDVFQTMQATKAVERFVALRTVGLPRLRAEGSSTEFDNSPGQTFVYNCEVSARALGYAITRLAIDDNQYERDFKPTQLGLQNSFATFKEIEAASIFNLSTVHDTALGGDGVSLLNTAHPVPAGGTWANTSVVPLALNEASLSASMTAVRTNFVKDNGIRINARARCLIVPPQLEGLAIRLTKTELRPGTANNDVNEIQSLSGGLPDGYMVMDYLTSALAWFLKTNIDGFIHLQRTPFETSMWTDDFTDNLLVKAYERCGFFYNDPRCVYGQVPTS